MSEPSLSHYIISIRHITAFESLGTPDGTLAQHLEVMLRSEIKKKRYKNVKNKTLSRLKIEHLFIRRQREHRLVRPQLETWTVHRFRYFFSVCLQMMPKIWGYRSILASRQICKWGIFEWESTVVWAQGNHKQYFLLSYFFVVNCRAVRSILFSSNPNN